MERDALIADIAAFAAKVGWTPATVCHKAVGNGHLYRRMTENGGNCSITVAERLRRFMADAKTAPQDTAA